MEELNRPGTEFIILKALNLSHILIIQFYCAPFLYILSTLHPMDPFSFKSEIYHNDPHAI